MKKLLSLKKYKKFISSAKVSKETRFGLRANLKRDWKILLVGFALANIFVLVFSFLFFLKISSRAGLAIQPEESLNIDTVDRGSLDSLLNKLEEKDREFERLEKSRPSSFDPSL